MRVGLLELVLLLAAVLVAVVGAWRLLTHGGRRAGGPVVLASWTRTPGVLNPAVTQATIRSTICVRGLDAHRAAAGLVHEPPEGGAAACSTACTARSRRFQEDHLVSLELGGKPTDARNLWPEPYPRAAEVDRIENQLNRRGLHGRAHASPRLRRKESAMKHEEDG